MFQYAVLFNITNGLSKGQIASFKLHVKFVKQRKMERELSVHRFFTGAGLQISEKCIALCCISHIVHEYQPGRKSTYVRLSQQRQKAHLSWLTMVGMGGFCSGYRTHSLETRKVLRRTISHGNRNTVRQMQTRLFYQRISQWGDTLSEETKTYKGKQSCQKPHTNLLAKLRIKPRLTKIQSLCCLVWRKGQGFGVWGG